MVKFAPAKLQSQIGRTFAQPLGQTPRTVQVPLPAVGLPPGPDPLFTGYAGIPGFIEAALVLTITSAGAWVGIRTGMERSSSKYLKAAGWVGGIGSALLGLLYVGGKSGYGSDVGLPAVRVTPS